MWAVRPTVGKCCRNSNEVNPVRMKKRLGPSGGSSSIVRQEDETFISVHAHIFTCLVHSVHMHHPVTYQCTLSPSPLPPSSSWTLRASQGGEWLELPQWLESLCLSFLLQLCLLVHLCPYLPPSSPLLLLLQPAFGQFLQLPVYHERVYTVTHTYMYMYVYKQKHVPCLCSAYVGTYICCLKYMYMYMYVCVHVPQLTTVFALAWYSYPMKG